MAGAAASGNPRWRDGRAFAAVLVVYFVLAGLYLAATPVQEASDEARHVGMAIFLKQNGRLPDVRYDDVTLPRQESTQAPLYYVLAALVTADLDTTDADRFFQPRENSPIGRADLPGSRHMFVPQPDGFTLTHGMVGAIWRMRLLSVVLGAATLAAIWMLVRRSGSIEDAVFATLLVAGNPMWLFITASVNNDNLAVLAVAVTLLASSRVLDRNDCARAPAWAAIGVLTGLAVLAKASALVLVPALLLACGGRGPTRARSSAAFLGGVAVTSGWWFLRNQWLYGEPFATSQHIDLAQNARPSLVPLALLHEWDGFVKSFWGVFGGFNIIFSDSVYRVFYVITLVLLAAGLTHLVAIRRTTIGPCQVGAALLVFNLIAVAAWTARLWGSQGRLMFPSMAAIALLATAGLARLPAPYGRIARVAVVGFLVAMSLDAALRLIPGSYY